MQFWWKGWCRGLLCSHCPWGKKQLTQQHCFLSLHSAYTHVFPQEEHSLNIYDKLWIKIATFPADVCVMHTQMSHSCVPSINLCKPVIRYQLLHGSLFSKGSVNCLNKITKEDSIRNRTQKDWKENFLLLKYFSNSYVRKKYSVC